MEKTGFFKHIINKLIFVSTGCYKNLEKATCDCIKKNLESLFMKTNEIFLLLKLVYPEVFDKWIHSLPDGNGLTIPH